MPERGRHEEAFDHFLALGPGRSLAKLHAGLRAQGWDIALRTVEQWSSDHGWPDDAARIDAAARQLDQGRRIRSRAAQIAYHRQVLEGLIGHGLRTLSERAEAFRPGEAGRLVLEAIRLDRELAGDGAEDGAAREEVVTFDLGGAEDAFVGPPDADAAGEA